MSDEEFRLFCDLVVERCGVDVSSMRFIVERRLSVRLEALGLPSSGAYLRYLRRHPLREEELERVIEAVTTRETYFFRDPQQLRAFRDELLPRLKEAARPVRRLRLWSAGCSTGEEAYTLAMLLADDEELRGWEVQVLGTDISSAAIAVARGAEYGPWSLRAAPLELTAKHFEVLPGPRYRVLPARAARVRFATLNLLEPAAASFDPPMDAVFCRNVLMYLEPRARERALATLWRGLAPGGYLLLGHAENLLSSTTEFALLPLKDDLAYRRPEVGGGRGGGA